MKKTRFTETQIVKAIQEEAAGRNANDICRDMGVSKATFYNWKKKYAGMEVNQVKQLKELQEENRKLKAMYADLALDHRILKDIIEKKSKALSEAAVGGRSKSRSIHQHRQSLPDSRTIHLSRLLQKPQR